MLYRETCSGLPSRAKHPRNSRGASLICEKVKESKYHYDEENLHRRGGCYIHTRRSQGRAKTGERAYRTVSGQKGPNITVCVAVSADQGLEHFEIITGGMKKA